MIGFATGVKMFTASASPDACIRSGSKELLEEEPDEQPASSGPRSVDLSPATMVVMESSLYRVPGVALSLRQRYECHERVSQSTLIHGRAVVPPT